MGRKLEIEGIVYEFKTPTFGEDLDTVDNAMTMNGADPRSPVNISNRKMNLLSIASVLKSWTFRGYDKDTDTLMKEPVPVVPISEEMIASLPARHGSRLLVEAKRITSLSEVEVKNLS